MATLLPDTAIASSYNDDALYMYTQEYYGRLQEGISKDGLTFKTKIIPPTSWDSVKLFTPLAAALFNNGTSRYLFYIDKAGVLNNLINEYGEWKTGDLGLQNIIPAHYSKFTAVTNPEWDGESIHVYYQISDTKGSIKEVQGCNGKWKRVEQAYGDPPLFGTSLAAVRPEPGIVIHSPSDDNVPVVFFQEFLYKTNNLKLAELQKTNFRELKPVIPKASPHTPLAAVDDGSNAYLFYTSDGNQIRRITINAEKEQIHPLDIDSTTPKGNLAAVIWKGMTNGTSQEKIVVIYQPQTRNITVSKGTDAEIAVNDQNHLAVASFSFVGSGNERTLAEPVFSHIFFDFE